MHAAQVAAKRSGWGRTALIGLICAAVALLLHYAPRYWARYQIRARGLDGSHFDTRPESEQRIRGAQLADAICGGRADDAHLFLKAGYPVTGHSYETDMTALHCAAFRADIPLMRELIERGAEVEAIAGENRLQPMHLAAAAAQVQAIHRAVERERRLDQCRQ